LAKFIVADPEICHGKPTFKGTRIMVWQVLDALARGETADEIVQAWAGKVSRVVARAHREAIHFWHRGHPRLQRVEWND